jgi:choline kinase
MVPEELIAMLEVMAVVVVEVVVDHNSKMVKELEAHPNFATNVVPNSLYNGQDFVAFVEIVGYSMYINKL